MTNRTLPIDDQLYRYLLDHSLRESATMKRLRELTAQHQWSGWQIAPEQAQFMALLVELTAAKRIIEVGTFTGYSALAMAAAMPEDGQLICCDVSEEFTSIARTFWEEANVASRIDLRIAPAMETLDQLLQDDQQGCFDMVFIDADKAAYADYYERSLVLLKSGGLVLFDNTLWDGRVADQRVTDEDTVAIRRINEQLHKDQRVSLSLVPIGDGLTLARKRS
jgi:predicted O-methyltransferase YrrM